MVLCNASLVWFVSTDTVLSTHSHPPSSAAGWSHEEELASIKCLILKKSRFFWNNNYFLSLSWRVVSSCSIPSCPLSHPYRYYASPHCLSYERARSSSDRVFAGAAASESRTTDHSPPLCNTCTSFNYSLMHTHHVHAFYQILKGITVLKMRGHVDAWSNACRSKQK